MVSPPSLLPGDGLLSQVAPKTPRVPFPPFDALDQLVGDGRRFGAAREQLFGPVNFGRFAEDRRAAAGDDQVAGDAERRIGGDAAVAVGAAAVGAENDFAGRHGFAPQ